MQWRSLIALWSIVLFVGCGGEYSENIGGDSLVTISHVSVNNTLQMSDKRVVKVDVHIQSDAQAQEVPFAYYLVSTDKAERTIDGNITARVPVRQYYIGSDFINLNSQDIDRELNITLPAKVEQGEYKVAVFIDPAETKKLATPRGSIFESDTPIDVPKVVNDVELVSLSFDNDDNVLIIKNDNADSILSMTAVVQSNGEDIEGCYLKATLILNAQRIPLEFLGDELKDPLKFDLSKLSQVKKHASLEIKISKELKENLLTSLGDKIYDAQLEVTLVSDLENESLDNNTKDIALSVYKKLSTSSMKRAASPTGSVLLKSFSTNFSADKKDDNFGIGLNENVYAHFSTLDSGVSSTADLNARVLGNDYAILGLDIEGFVQYDSFENTGYSIVLKVFGANVFIKSDDMASMAQSVPEAALTDEEKATLTAEEQRKLLAKRQIKINADPDNIVSKLEYIKDFSTSKSLSVTRAIPVGLMHVDVTAGLEGEIGFHNEIKLNGVLSISANSGPKAGLSGFASGGIGVAAYSAGVKGSYTFVSNYFRGESNFEFAFSGDEQDLRLKGTLSQKVINTFEGPKGTLDIYLRKTTLGKCFAGYMDFCAIPNPFGCTLYVKEELWLPCDIVESEDTINIFSWDSQKSTDHVLLEVLVVLSDNKIY